MADEMDRAQALEERQRRQALARATAARTAGPSAYWCESCGEAIPPARRVAVPGVRRCAFCQAEAERNR